MGRTVSIVPHPVAAARSIEEGFGIGAARHGNRMLTLRVFLKKPPR